MGTPEISVHCLDKIDRSHHKIVAVVTVPDKPAGRGLKINKSPVKEFAENRGFDVLQPEKLKDVNFIKQLKKYNADLFVVVAFRMLPKEVWSLPKKGTINLHASLLPDYRGAAPINHAIINGENKTGVTVFFIDEQIDTGKIIEQKEIEITKQDNAGTLHDKIMAIGAILLVDTITKIEENKFDATEQNILINNVQLKPAPKIFKENCRINWNNKAENIYNFIRGLSPYPAAWTELKCSEKILNLKIFECSYKIENHKTDTGSVFFDKETITITCSDGIIKLLNIQLEGKKRMDTKDFLRGFKTNDCIIV